jgi:Glycine-zipper domain
MKRNAIFAIAASVLISSAGAFAQNLYVYPQKGQSKQQQEKDEFECHKWAKDQTGFDPMAQPSSPAAAAPAPKGGAVRGAAKGAALGAIGGAIAGDAGKGAAIGAGVGGAGGALRRRGQVQQQQQAQQAQASAQNAQRSQYQRAYGACLEGRGYTVK